MRARVKVDENLDGCVKNLKVLFLSIYDPYAKGSGPRTHLRYLSQALSKMGCEVHILVLHSKKSGRVMNGVQVHYLNSHFHIPSVWKGFVFPLLSSKDVNSLCKEYEIDIVHGQSPSSFGYALLRKNATPFVVTLHGTSFGEISSYLKMPFSWFHFSSMADAMVLQPLWAFLTHIEYNRADKVIAVSRATAKEAVQFYGLREDKVVTIYNGVTLPKLYFNGENEQHMILSVGRLAWRKGFKYLLDAMPDVLTTYSDAKLFLVGEGKDKVFLEGYARKLGIERSVCFTGKVSNRMLYSLYARAGVYVQPSLYEPFGITILEAMAMGKPVVATRVGGIPEFVINGVNGLIVDSGNSLALADAIMNVFSDATYAQKLAAEGKEKVQKEFTWEKTAQKTFRLYKQLLGD